MTSSTVKVEYISLQAAAVLYAVSVDLLRRRIATGVLPAVHVGRRLIRVRVDDRRRMSRPPVGTEGLSDIARDSPWPCSPVLLRGECWPGVEAARERLKKAR